MSAWLFYALLAPLLFAFVNVFDKFLREKHLGTFTLSVIVGLWSFWAVALIPFVNFPSSPTVIITGLLAGVLFFVSALPYFHALSIEEASRVIPLWALETPLVLIMAFIFLKERLVASDYVGFVLVVTGTFLIAARKVSEVLKPGKAFFLMLLASIFTSIGITLLKWLFSEAPFWSVQVLLSLGTGTAAIVSLLVFGSRRKEFLRNVLQLKTGVVLKLMMRQLFFVAGGLVFGVAVMIGSASLSAALVQLSALFVFIIATFLSKFWPRILEEAIDKKALLTKAFAIAMVIAGVFAINV